jgi:hypothetical protein
MDDLTEEERQAVIAALKTLIDEVHYPHSPLLAPFRSALAKLDPSSVPRPLPKRIPLPEVRGRRPRP